MAQHMPWIGGGQVGEGTGPVLLEKRANPALGMLLRPLFFRASYSLVVSNPKYIHIRAQNKKLLPEIWRA